MKTKMILLFAAFLFAAVTVYNLQLVQTQNLGDISLADITVMAKADGESGDITCHQNWEYGRWNICWIKEEEPSPGYDPCAWSGSITNICCLVYV